MSYSIDFHFGNVLMGPGKTLEQVDLVLRRACLTFLNYCHELYLDEDGEADTSFPAVTVKSIKEGAMAGKGWIGRSHYYRWQTQFDLDVYAWSKPKNALVLSMAYNEWKRVIKEPVSLDKVVDLICSVSEETGSPFGLSMVNSSYLPLQETAFTEAMKLLKRDAAEPDLFWVSEKHLPHGNVLAAIGSHRTVIRSPLGYSLALKVDSDSEAKTSYAKPMEAIAA
jgi:hypothetical protein